MQETVRGCGVIRNVSPFEGEVLGAGPSVLTKCCSHCKQELPLTSFHIKDNRKGENSVRNSWCSPCSRENAKRHYRKNPKVYMDRATEYRKNIRLIHQEYVKTQKCAICGENDPVVLEFHHLGDKDKDISKLTRSGNLSKYYAERDKCQVLCANCHRRVTARELGYNKDL